MKLDALRLFCDVVETRNFTRAAERNGITQSAVSQMLQALEKEFGARLVDRRRHVFQLTPAGEICHQHSREIVRLAGELGRGPDRDQARLSQHPACPRRDRRDRDQPAFAATLAERAPLVQRSIDGLTALPGAGSRRP